MRFKDKVVLIVGGNSGIGRAAAIDFGREGAHVILTGRDQRTIDETVNAIPGAQGFRGDIADIESLKPVVAAIEAQHGRIDILFVNAGIGAFAPVTEVTPEQWDQVHNVNLRGCFFAVQAALPLMTPDKRSGGGAIIITGSIGSVAAVPGNVMYAAAKAGLRAVARTLAAELVGQGIRVNMVSPGPTETPIINRTEGVPADAVPGLRNIMTEAVPMKRMGTPEEIARPVLFLASDDASFITGIDLYVDGGCVEL